MPPLKTFVRHEIVKDAPDKDDWRQLQDRVDEVTRPITESAIVAGRSVEGVEIPDTPGAVVQVRHQLGRRPKGYHVVDRNQPASIFSAQPPDDKFLYLSASGAVVASLWVF